MKNFKNIMQWVFEIIILIGGLFMSFVCFAFGNACLTVTTINGFFIMALMTLVFMGLGMTPITIHFLKDAEKKGYEQRMKDGD